MVLDMPVVGGGSQFVQHRRCSRHSDKRARSSEFSWLSKRLALAASLVHKHPTLGPHLRSA
jgi:hypothetical protein